jgi:hypothetical protein
MTKGLDTNKSISKKTLQENHWTRETQLPLLCTEPTEPRPAKVWTKAVTWTRGMR